MSHPDEFEPYGRTQPRLVLLLIMLVPALTSLACTLGELISPPQPGRVVIRISLPTLTPTANAPATPAVNEVMAAPAPVDLAPTAYPTAAPPVIAATTPTSSLPVAPAAPTATYVAQEALASHDETPTPEPTIPPTMVVEAVPTSPVSEPTPIVIDSATPIPETPGWSFANIRTYTDVYEGGLLLYGDLINDTGASQKLAYITGAFYNEQGQVIASQDNTTEYWPVDIVPPGGKAPFELAVNGIEAAANYRLWANSATAGQMPRQDFNFAGVEQWSEDESYCLAGQMQNPGGQLRDYLVIAAVLYDSQGNVANFSETYETEPQDISGDEPLDFEICIDPPNQNVARYELRAWGE